MGAIQLKVYVTPFADGGVTEAAKWNCDSAKDALNVVNAIWSKANISFAMAECVSIEPATMAKDARNSDIRLLNLLTFKQKADGTVHIFLVNPILNLNAGGGSYPSSDPEPASFVQWYGNAEASGRAWAHELGHLLTLDHVKIDFSNEKQAAARRGNLMVEGLSAGRDLTSAQIQQVKRSKLVSRTGG